MLVDSRDTSRMSSMRIPFDKRRVEHTGPIVCEAAWDAQEHILWIWDVIVWERQVIWNFVPYSKRWDILKEVVGKILDCGHPMSDAEVRVPDWVSMAEISKIQDIDVAHAIDFQPESPGGRRHVFRVQNTDIKFKPISYAERKMVADNESRWTVPAAPDAQTIQTALTALTALQATTAPQAPPVSSDLHTTHPTTTIPPVNTERPTVGRARKDTTSKLPDTYILETVTGESLGLAAIRSLAMSKQLRTALAKNDSTIVDILWFEPFSKYEIRAVH
jgi:hypothetical protein